MNDNTCQCHMSSYTAGCNINSYVTSYTAERSLPASKPQVLIGRTATFSLSHTIIPRACRYYKRQQRRMVSRCHRRDQLIYASQPVPLPTTRKLHRGDIERLSQEARGRAVLQGSSDRPCCGTKICPKPSSLRGLTGGL